MKWLCRIFGKSVSHLFLIYCVKVVLALGKCHFIIRKPEKPVDSVSCLSYNKEMLLSSARNVILKAALFVKCNNIFLIKMYIAPLKGTQICTLLLTTSHWNNAMGTQGHTTLKCRNLWLYADTCDKTVCVQGCMSVCMHVCTQVPAYSFVKLLTT